MPCLTADRKRLLGMQRGLLRSTGQKREKPGTDLAVLLNDSRAAVAARWFGNTRNWSPVGAVTLNPEGDCIIKAHSANNNIQVLAA